MIFIDDQLCKGCGICVAFCPKHVLQLCEQVNARGFCVPIVVDGSACGQCSQCQRLCPDFAIFIIEEEVRGD